MALIHSLSHAPDVTCYLQTVKSGQRTSGQPDYGVYFEMHEGVVLSKETIGHSTVADCTLRIFPDDEGRMNRSLADTGGGALVVSQFTLVASTRRGRRPSYSRAAPPDIAEPLYVRFADRLAARGVSVASGVFRAMMEVELVNDGPVTILLEPSPGRGAS